MVSSARVVAAGVDEDQAWSSQALSSSRQAPDALTYISLTQTVRAIERVSEGERERERTRVRGMGWAGNGGCRERERERAEEA